MILVSSLVHEIPLENQMYTKISVSLTGPMKMSECRILTFSSRAHDSAPLIALLEPNNFNIDDQLCLSYQKL